jgi:hypothetical protein
MREVIEPGTASTWRPHCSAQPALFNAPLRTAASTTTVPRVLAAINLLRARKRSLVGEHLGGSSLTSKPVSAMRSKSAVLLFG